MNPTCTIRRLAYLLTGLAAVLAAGTNPIPVVSLNPSAYRKC